MTGPHWHPAESDGARLTQWQALEEEARQANEEAKRGWRRTDSAGQARFAAHPEPEPVSIRVQRAILWGIALGFIVGLCLGYFAGAPR
jgi:ferric-dicitrate binding protein FerR (iron transport regulator)